MHKVLALTVRLVGLAILAVGGVVFLMRLQPHDSLTDATVERLGSENVLLVGDYIDKYGPPTGEDYTCDTYGIPTLPQSCTVDIWWGSLEIDIDSPHFTPFSTVEFTNTDNSPATGTRWRGFVSIR